MFTLIKKRKDRALKKTAMQAGKSINVDEAPLNEQRTTSRIALEDKPWEEIQNTLKIDLSYVKNLAGSAEKTPYKLTLIEKYRALVNRLIETHERLDNLDVVWWFYLWQIDCGLLTEVHDEFKALVLKGLETPHKWSSNGQTAYCDIIFKYSHTANATGNDFNVQYLTDAVNDLITGRLATNAPLKVKMFRLAGDLLLNAKQHKDALDLYKMVMLIDPNKGGRKTKIKELEELLDHEENNG
ncbi:MAG: phage terminase small subunit [Psychromonas sp.]